MYRLKLRHEQDKFAKILYHLILWVLGSNPTRGISFSNLPIQTSVLACNSMPEGVSHMTLHYM